jgi:hypothetical protein
VARSEIGNSLAGVSVVRVTGTSGLTVARSFLSSMSFEMFGTRDTPICDSFVCISSTVGLTSIYSLSADAADAASSTTGGSIGTATVDCVAADVAVVVISGVTSRDGRLNCELFLCNVDMMRLLQNSARSTSSVPKKPAGQSISNWFGSASPVSSSAQLESELEHKSSGV